MRNAYNSVCSACQQFRPRCATVYRRVSGKATVYESTPRAWCPECRKANHGKYRLDDRHK